MRLLDEQYTRAPFYGSRKMTEWLATQGFEVNRKRVSRLEEDAAVCVSELRVAGGGRELQGGIATISEEDTYGGEERGDENEPGTYGSTTLNIEPAG